MTARRPFVVHRHPHTVYRLYADKTLLYVGVTSDLRRRLYGHHDKPWWPKVNRIEQERTPTREDALLAEEFYIRWEKPLHNILGWGHRRGPQA